MKKFFVIILTSLSLISCTKQVSTPQGAANQNTFFKNADVAVNNMAAVPVINGLELRQKLNEHDTLRLKALPFLFWSTSGSEALINQAYSLNIQGFFKKPSSLEELKQIITAILNYWDSSCHPLT